LICWKWFQSQFQYAVPGIIDKMSAGHVIL
jgi:hypothetical protein